MGTYFNPGNGSFRKAISSDVYIDKTGLIFEMNKLLNTENNCISLSHARRFGKSQAAGMLEAYYSIGCDSKELFSKYEISKKSDFEEHLNKYNVIHLDVSSFLDNFNGDVSVKIWNTLYREMNEVIPNMLEKSENVGAVLQDVYKKTNRQFVIIIDEWDAVIRNRSDKLEMIHSYLQFLHSMFKSAESKEYLALAYITGILPIKKIKDESALNNFREYTMLESDQLTKYFGFTEDEVRELAEKYQMNFDTVKAWYNGYNISGIHMYNPNSVCEAMARHRFDSYWKNTSSFQMINDLISLDMEGLKADVLSMLEGKKVSVNVFKFKNDLSEINSKDEAITALIHLGYLGYDFERKMAYIPNFEVSLAYEAALATGSWKEIAKTISRCNELLWATIDGDSEKVAELIELSHDAYTSILKYNDENALSCAITMAYFTAPAYYNIIRELPSGKGFADIAMIPRADSKNKPAIIVELKWDKDADTALKQIKEKRYAGALAGYGDKTLLVGVNYDKETRKHSCEIEEMVSGV